MDEAPNSRRLDSWKEIAAYLGRGVTTVRRWEQTEGLPVRRLLHAKKGSVFAFTSELDAWRSTRAHRELPEEGDDDARSLTAVLRRYRSALTAIGAVVLLILAAATGLTFARGWPARTAASRPMLTARPLANDRTAETGASLSPDGERVVYSWRRDDEPGLYIKPVGGGPAHRIPMDGGTFADGSYAKWSPRGDLIAFLARDGAELDIRRLHVVPPGGGTPRYVASIAGIGMCWTPDGRAIAFADRKSSGEPLAIFSIALENGQRVRLTDPPPAAFGDTQCAFSPDGTTLAFSRYLSRGQSDMYLTSVGAAPRAVQRLTYGQEGVTGIDWAPDGRTIVFGSEAGLLRIPAARGWNGDPVPVIPLTGVRTLLPSFSRPASGQPARLAFEHNVRDVNLWRWVAEEPDSPKPLAESSTWWEDSPAFSPDGRRIVFSSNRTSSSEIWTANADGSSARQLTFHGGPIVVQGQWSPDGRRVAFSSQAGANRDIYVVQADGSKPVRLTKEDSKEEYPSWSRDGRWIYFSSDRSGTPQIWRMPSDGGAAERVTASQASQAFESADGSTLYFVRSPDVPGVWSVPVAGGAETFVLADAKEAYWGVADAGIAFLVASPAQSPGGPTIRFFDFASRRVRTLATLSVAPRRALFGFAVSRDARSVLWTQLDRSDSDIMLIDAWQP